MNKQSLACVLFLLLLLALALVACGGRKKEKAASETPTPTEVPAGNPENGKQVFLVELCRRPNMERTFIHTTLDDWIAREAIPFSIASPETLNAAIDMNGL